MRPLQKWITEVRDWGKKAASRSRLVVFSNFVLPLFRATLMLSVLPAGTRATELLRPPPGGTRNMEPAHKEREQHMLAARRAPAFQVLLLITPYTNTTNTTTSGQEISSSLVSLDVIPFFFFLTACPPRLRFLDWAPHSDGSMPAA